MPRLLLALQSLLLALVLTWPTAATLRSAAVGSLDGDGSKHVWTLWWMKQELWDGTPGLRTTWVNFPEGMELYPIEPLNGIVAVFWPGDPVTLSNLLAILHVSLLGIAAGWLGRLVSGSRLGAHMAGALAQGCAFTAFTLHVGVGELRQYWWIPLGLGCLVKARESLEWKWFLALAASLAGAVLSCFYHGLFLGVAVALYALATLAPRPRLLAGYLLAAGLAVGVVWPVVRSFSANYGGNSAPQPIFSPDGRVQTDYRGAAMQLQELLSPRRDARGGDRQTVTYTGGRYLGWGAVLLLLVGLAAAPRRAAPWVVVLGGSAILSLGSVLWVNGAVVESGGRPLVLPLAWINHWLRQFAEPINFPARFIAPGMIALAAGASLASRWRWSAALVPLALVDVAYNELVPWPRATFALPEMTGLEGGGGAVADVQLAINSDPESRTLDIAAQIQLGRPFQSVPVERQDKWAPGGTLWLQQLPVMAALDATWHGKPTRPGGDPRVDQWLLRERGFDRVILTHRTGSPQKELREVLEAVFGQPILIAPHAHLYAVAMPVATDEEKTAWTAAHELRLKAAVPPSFGPQYPSGTPGPPVPR